MSDLEEADVFVDGTLMCLCAALNDSYISTELWPRLKAT